MSSAPFDTLEAAEALTHAGLAEPHARAIAAMVRKAVSEGAATKADIGEVRAEIAGVRAEIGELRSEVRAEIAGVRAEIGEFKGEVRTEVGVVKAELWAIKWVLGFLFAIVVAMAARLFGIV